MRDPLLSGVFAQVLAKRPTDDPWKAAAQGTVAVMARLID